MGALQSLIAYPLFRLTICLATGIFLFDTLWPENLSWQYGAAIWLFLPVFAEEYSGFPVGGGDGFSAEWLEGLFLVGRNIGTSSERNSAI